VPTTPKPRRRGRPQRQASSKTLPTLSFRAAPETRALLEAAAAEAGRSLSAEIDRRLQQAFWDHDRYRAERDRAFGGNHNYVLGFVLARVAAGVEHSCGHAWADNHLVWREVSTAVVAMLQLLRGFCGGSVELPLSNNRCPNPKWVVDNYSKHCRQQDPAKTEELCWVHVLRVLDAVLSNDVPMYWPLVDEIRQSHDDFRGEFVPRLDELRALYRQTGAAVALD